MRIPRKIKKHNKKFGEFIPKIDYFKGMDQVLQAAYRGSGKERITNLMVGGFISPGKSFYAISETVKALNKGKTVILPSCETTSLDILKIIESVSKSVVPGTDCESLAKRMHVMKESPIIFDYLGIFQTKKNG